MTKPTGKPVGRPRGRPQDKNRLRKYFVAQFESGFVMTRQTEHAYTHAWYYDFESALLRDKKRGAPLVLRVKGFAKSEQHALSACNPRMLNIVYREIAAVRDVNRTEWDNIHGRTGHKKRIGLKLPPRNQVVNPKGKKPKS